MILPNVSLESLPALIKQYEEEQVFSCVSTKNHFHGTMWPSLKRTSFVLWDNITTTFSYKRPLFQLTIKLSDSGTYLFSESNSDFTVIASHPILVNSRIKLPVNRVGSGQGCIASSDVNVSKTNVIFTLFSSTELLGASVSITCKNQAFID